MRTEIWKDVEGFEGLYKVSNLGNVMSLGREVVINKADKRPHVFKPRIMKQHKNKYGYLSVELKGSDRKTKTQKYVHQLVAYAFIGNPLGLHDVNHKNEKKDDNRVENLEFCDRKYNCNYGTAIERKRKTMYKKAAEIYPNVLQYDLDMNLVNEFPNACSAARTLGYSYGGICRCCRGERNHYKGYIWKYKK